MNHRNRMTVPALKQSFAALLILFGLLFGSYAPAAQDGAKGGVSFGGQVTKIARKEGAEAVSLSGSAWVRTGTITIEADAIDISGANYRFLTCRGNVVLNDSDKEITLFANALTYDRDTRILTVSGWSELFDRRNELIARGAYLRSDEERETILLQIAVSITRADEEGEILYCRADSALFDSAVDLLELTGSAMVSYKGSNYQAARIVVNLETNDIIMEGGVRGTVDE